MNKINYQKELDRIIEQVSCEGRRPSLLLHSCCGPCSSYCLEYLTQYFDVTVYYYNPNITDEEEYRHRVSEQQRLIKEFPGVRFVEGPYDPESFYEISAGLEKVPEGGERCFRCFSLRLGRAAQYAADGGFDYYTTTLTISPMKDAQKLNEIGQQKAAACGTTWLPSDFKKKDGYKRSVELSARYGLYRQDYCGCEYSKEEARARKNRQQAQTDEGWRG